MVFPGAQPDDGDYRHLYPKVCLGIRINQHEHILPYSMGLIENLKYPKDRIHVAFFSEESSDQDTLGSAKYWSAQNSKMYLSTAVIENRKNTREEALQWARMKNCDFAFITSPDDFLMANILKKLIDLKFVVVSPLLNGPFGTHSNVHGLLDSSFFDRVKVGSQQVYYCNGPHLINLKEIDSSYLTFDSDNLKTYNGPDNPIQIFAHSAYSMKIPVFVDNREFYGYILDSTFYSINHHRRLLGYFLANLISDNGPMPFPHSIALEPWYPTPSQLGFDQIYVINLKRRPERLQKMDLIMRLLGIEYRVFEAVDGHSLTPEQLSYLQFLPGYEDPYYKRPMKKGEIGCFLSHYGIWNHIVQRGFERVLIFEDDVRFSENSTVELSTVIEDIIKTRLEWDLIYLGRKKMTPHGDEFFVPGHRYLSTLAYSYWTLGYALSLSGAQKLLAARPLEKMLALDEFLPIMYDKHPNKEWSSNFPERNLKAYAVYPVVVTPERYTHDAGYVSDTEASTIVDFGQKKNQSILARENESLRNNVHASSTVTKNELFMGCINSKCDIEADGRRLVMLKEIAQGGFSVIFLAKDIDSGEKVVVKKIDCHSTGEIERTRKEFKIHESFGANDNIIHILAAVETLLDGGITRFYLVFPYRNMGSLQAELERRSSTKEYFDAKKVISLFEQVCNAVRSLHHFNPPLIHRDLKPANVLFVDEDHVELTDFGSCMNGPVSVKDGRHSRHLVDDAGEHSTMTYRAPELFNCDTGTVLDQSIDIWSLGCVLYAICYFKSPFDEAYEKGDSVPLAAMSGRIKFPSDIPFPHSLNELILQLLKVEARERPDIDSVMTLLKSYKSNNLSNGN